MGIMSPSLRMIWGTVILVLAACILVIAPLLVFEDRSPGPSHGQDRNLQSAALPEPEGWPGTLGRIFGLLAATLLFFQFGLSSKLKPLDRVFGLHRLLYFHRILGISLVILASLHPLFMFSLGTAEIGPLRPALWPLLLGILLLTGLWTGVFAALWRKFLAIPYHRWYPMHRFVMIGAVGVFTLHAWNVTDDFHGGWPLYGLGTALLLYAALFAWTAFLKPAYLKKRTYTVTKTDSIGKDAHGIELIPGKGKTFDYAPGQFAFVTFFSEGLPVERHHWTISSTPTRPESLVFTIKSSGDFTALIDRVRPGDRAAVDGPYGLFTYRAHILDPEREIVMVAGGIGITPMLSMLRYMNDRGDHRRVTLIWSNRTEEHILYREELEAMEKDSLLTVHNVLTRQDDFQGYKGRLTIEMLREILTGHTPEAAVFLCGPPPMMKAVSGNLRRLGFRRPHIYKEKFSY